MKNRAKKTSLWANKHLRYIIGIMVACSAVYYLPVIAGWLGATGLQSNLNVFHNLYGIDFLGLVFFAPVVYAAYMLGVIPAVMAALVSMLLLLPYAILIDTYPNALFKPTAFVIILSAVGATVAMLQKSEQEHRQRMKEMKCLYDIGRATEDSHSLPEFLGRLVELIPQAMPYADATQVSITFRDETYQSPDLQKSPGRITEDLYVGGEIAGRVEIYSGRDNPYLKKRNHLTRTLAERIGGAIHELELKQSLQGYYEQLEKEVENRTRDLEKVQEKLIRSERLAAVGELASGVGHELRNPLNVIRNCAYLLNMSLDGAGDEEAVSTLAVLDKQIDVANKIVTDLLDFTRIKPPTPGRVDLNSLINESLSLVTVGDNVKVNANLNGHDYHIRTDAEQMGRVFINIIANAVQAMSGGGQLTIDTGNGGSMVWTRFTDTGCGIPAENLEKIFEPLFTTKPKGIGLGLAITKRLVEQNGGQIEVSSQPDKGTAFTIKLPAEQRR